MINMFQSQETHDISHSTKEDHALGLDMGHVKHFVELDASKELGDFLVVQGLCDCPCNVATSWTCCTGSCMPGSDRNETSL
jgi:hypothetical protein